MVYRRTDRMVRRLAARHDAILAASQAVAEEGGMAAVQIVPVAERAGIAAGTVYRYFSSKEALVTELAGRITAREVAAIRAAAAAAPGPLSAIAAAIAAIAALALRQRKLIWALTAEPVDAETEAARSGFRTAVTSELQQLVQAAIGSNLIPRDQHVGFAAPALVGALLEGLLGPLAPQIAPGAAEREAVQSATLFVLRALGVSDARARGLVVQISLPAVTEGAA